MVTTATIAAAGRHDRYQKQCPGSLLRVSAQNLFHVCEEVPQRPGHKDEFGIHSGERISAVIAAVLCAEQAQLPDDALFLDHA